MKLTIILLTYDRLEYAETTLRSTLKHLKWSGELGLHIADDGSPDGYVQHLIEVAVASERLKSLSLTNAGRRGYGASYNLATQQVHCGTDLVLPLEDDWCLMRGLDADALARVFEEDASIGAIRLGYIGFTQRLRGTIRGIAGQTFLEFDPDSEERHVFAGHPRIETVAYERRVGPWPEGLDPGTTEFEVAGIRAAREGVLWPMDLRPHGDAYAHIGTIQARGDQREQS